MEMLHFQVAVVDRYCQILIDSEPMKILVALVLSLVVFLQLGTSFVAHAQAFPADTTDVSINQGATLYKIVDLGLLFERGLKVAIGLVGIIILGYLIWGGLDWILAGEDKGKVEAARSKITQGVIGLALFVSVFAIYFILDRFLSLSPRFNVTGGAGGSGGGGSAQNTCAGGTAIGSTVNDGGSGGYCSNGGAAMVKCVGPGVGPSNFTYAHFEPCSCVTGTLLPGYSTSGCQ